MARNDEDKVEEAAKFILGIKYIVYGIGALIVVTSVFYLLFKFANSLIETGISTTVLVVGTIFICGLIGVLWPDKK